MLEVVAQVLDVGFGLRIKTAKDDDCDSDEVINKAWKSYQKKNKAKHMEVAAEN